MSKNILIVDAFGYWHIGNGALLENSIKLLKKADPSCKITILSSDSKNIRRFFDNVNDTIFDSFANKGLIKKLILYLLYFLFCALHLLNLFIFHLPPRFLCFSKRQHNAMDAMLACDVAISISGEAINDIFWKNLIFLLFQYYFLIKHKKRFILFPQSIGPLRPKWLQKVVHFSLKDADLLVARDNPSYNTLKTLGFKQEQIYYSIDVAVMQEAKIPPADINVFFPTNTQNHRTIGVTISDFPHEIVFKKSPLEILIAALKENVCPANYRILLMPSNYIEFGESNDYRICRDFSEKLRSLGYSVAILENRMQLVDNYVSLLKQLFIFISTRMHVSILATAQGIPTIAISSQYKIKNYMSNLGYPECAFLPEEMSRLSQGIDNIIAKRDEIAQGLLATIAIQKQETLVPLQEKIKTIILK